jgi:hypothetical protein
MLTFITSGGFMKVVAPMAVPAEAMEIPIRLGYIWYCRPCRNDEDLQEAWSSFPFTGRNYSSDAGVSVTRSGVIPWRGRRQESYSLSNSTQDTRRDTDMQDMFTQSENEFQTTHISGVEGKNRRLKILVSEF